MFKNEWKFGSIIMILFAIAACGGGGDTIPPPSGTYTISGTVTGASDVTLSLSGAETGSATTGGGGNYSFSGLANGSYTVTPSKSGYTFSPTSTVVPVGGADVGSVNFTATVVVVPTHTISGTVTGVSGVTITLSGAETGSATTGGGGNYSFSGLVNGSYTVTPSKSGYTFSPTSTVVLVGGADVGSVNFTATTVVVPTYSISGTVTGASGVTIILSGAGTGSATTDVSGNYSFSGLANGSYTVTPSKSGYTFSPTSTVVPVGGVDVGSVNFTATTVGGTLDTSFGSNGIAKFGVSAFPGIDKITDIAIQADGKIIAIGRAENDSAIVRLNADGSADTTFATAGTLIISAYSYYSVVIQSDGKIVVGGVFDTTDDFAIARYDVSGAIDTAFGTAGITTINAGTSDFVNGLAIQSDGKIVAAGQSGSNSVVIRLTSSGLPDATLGGSGIVITTTNTRSVATDIAVQSDGKIVVSGYTRDSQSKWGWLVIRYNADGTLDTTFADNGKATTVIGANYSSYYDNDFAYSLAIQSDGKIVVGGGTGGDCVPPSCTSSYKFALARYGTDGTLDTTFGTAGTQLGTYVWAFIKSIALQSDDKIVATGPMTSSGEFIVARFNAANGSPDATFIDSDNAFFEPTAGTGEVIVEPSSDIFYWSSAYSVAIQPSDGKIVVGGYACGGYNGVNPEFTIIRLMP